jgi:hypothetical protein
VGTLRPCGAKRVVVAGGAGPSQTHGIDEFLSVSRGQPVGSLAASSDGGGIAAESRSRASRAGLLQPASLHCAGALRRLPRLRLIVAAGTAPYAGWL